MGKKRLKDRCAVLTGAAGGIAQATALSFASEGANLVLTDINGAGMEEILGRVSSKGVKVKALAADVTRR